MKNKIGLVSVYFVFLHLISAGQQPGKTSPAYHPVNLMELNKKLDNIFKSFDTKNSPGCAVTILSHGQPIAKKAYGMASIELLVPFSHQNVVRIGYSEAREFISMGLWLGRHA